MRSRYLLFLALLVVTWAGFALTLQQSLQELSRWSQLAEHGNVLENHTLQLRRHEKDFLQRKRVDYRERFDAELEEALDLLEAMRTGQDEAGPIEAAEAALRSYADEFHAIVDAHQVLGLGPKDGLRGQFWASSQRLQQALAAEPDRPDQQRAALRERLSEAQASASAFLLDSTHAPAKMLDPGFVDASELDPATAALLAAHRESFVAVYEKMQAVGLDEESGAHGRMRAAAHEAEEHLDRIAARAHDLADAQELALEQRLLWALALTLALTIALAGGLLHTFRGLARTRQALEARSTQLEVTLQSIGDGVLTTDRDGKITLINGVAQQITGYTPQEAVGKHVDSVFRIYSGVTGERAETPVDEVLASGRIVGLANNTLLETRSGERRQIADSAAPIFGPNKEILGTVLVFRDVTEQYRLEEQLRQSGKLESLGLLAGGVAHDFNNLLAGIMGGAELLQLQSGLDAGGKQAVEVILQSSSRAADLTSKLLSFSRKGKLVSSPVDVHPLITRAVEILRRSLPKDIRVELELKAEKSWVVGDPSQLEAVFINLGINAADAMPDGGSIRFASSVIELDARYCEDSPFELEAGPHLQVSVRDEGVGIDATMQSKIFEPFFTTKREGEGTGLGLASAYGAIRDHAGELRVESVVGQGATFYLALPLRAQEGRTRDTSPEFRLPEGFGRVLVVDDEGYIRTTSRMILESLGYEVQLCESGRDALKYLASGEELPRVALIDMVMPGMGGEELFYKLKEAHPDLPVVLMSGFTKQANLGKLQEHGLGGFIRKPFTRAELARLIHDACEPRPSS